MKRLTIILPLLVMLFLTGCATTYSEEFFRAGANTGWTADQQLVGYFYSLRQLYGEQTDDGWVINEAALNVDDVLATINAMRGDINHVLSDARWMRLIRALDMEQPLLREDARLNSIKKRLVIKKLNAKFFDLIGETAGSKTAATPVSDDSEINGDYYSLQVQSDSQVLLDPHPSNSSPSGYTSGVGRQSQPKIVSMDVGGEFDIKVLWPLTDVSQYRFEPTYIKQARVNQTLILLTTYLVYDNEIDAASYAASVDRADASLVTEDRDAFIVLGYKVFDPDALDDEQVVDAVIVYRLFESDLNDDQITFAREEQPFVRGYRSLKGKSVDTWVADIDQPGQPGYGLPDVVKSMAGIKTSSDLYLDHAKQFVGDWLHYVKPVDRRELPEDKQITLEIVKAGQVNADPWQYSDDGWTVPFEYLKVNSNDIPDYKAWYLLTDHKLEYLEKRWGDVKERFYPKPQYADIEYALITTIGRIVVLEPLDGEQRRGAVEVWAEPLPYEIEYKFNDNTYLLRDNDGDGVFEARRVIAN